MRSDEDLHFRSEEERRKYLSDLVRLRHIREQEKRHINDNYYDDDDRIDFDLSDREMYNDYENDESNEIYDDDYDYDDGYEPYYDDDYEADLQHHMQPYNGNNKKRRRPEGYGRGYKEPEYYRSTDNARKFDRDAKRNGKTDKYETGSMNKKQRNAFSEAQDKTKKTGKKKKNIFLRIFFLLLLIFIIYFAYNYFTKQKGYYTVALFGVDSRDGNVDRGLSDVNIICNINRETGDVQLVSVYRDTYAQIDEKGTYHKINEAYFRGGAKQAVPALERNLDLKIEDYATFNWKAVADGINILGGIDIEITEPEFRYINSFITFTVKGTGIPSKHLEHAGMNHLDGVQAVAYSRLRLMDTDYNRTQRQRKVISLAFDKAKKADLATLKKLAETVLPQTSTSLTLDDLIPFMTNIKKYHLTDTTGFPFDKAGVDIGKKDCVVPVTLKSNVIALHKLLYKDEPYIPSPTLESINKKIIQDSGLGKDKNDTTPSLDDNSGKIGPEKTKPAQSANPTNSQKEDQEKNSKENEDKSKQTSVPNSDTKSSDIESRSKESQSKESSDSKSKSSSETIESTAPKPDKTTSSPSIIEDDEPDTTEAGPGVSTKEKPKEPTPETTENKGPGEE